MFALISWLPRVIEVRGKDGEWRFFEECDPADVVQRLAKLQQPCPSDPCEFRIRPQ